MSRPLAVVVGFLGKLPYGGMSLYNLHPIIGLRDLGYDVHYVETVDYPDNYYSPQTWQMTSSTAFGIDYIRRVLQQFECGDVPFSVVDLDRQCHGAEWPRLRAALARADFLLTLGTPSWLDDFAQCERRVFFDTDPMFTQVEMLEGGLKAAIVPRYDTLLSQCTRFGRSDCRVPDLGRTWFPMPPPVVTRLWQASPPGDAEAAVTALMHWSAGADVVHDGRTYGHKNREFQPYIDLPRKTAQAMALAVDGGAPRSTLRERGWHIVSPLEATETVSKYQAFIANTRADFGIAKHAYIESRCGWFSDRSACFLASGRPVLHQETGFTDWLPTGEGVLSFASPDGALEAIASLNADYQRHAKAARCIAEEHLEATTILDRMLSAVDLR